MVKFDDSLDTEDEDKSSSSKVNKKKLLLIILPVLITIGLVVSFFVIFKSNKKPNLKNYQIISKAAESKDGKAQTTIFYDLPEINAMLSSHGKQKQSLKLRISLEIGDLTEDKISVIDALSSKLNDIIISHLIEVYPEELQSAQGLYWLKEELQYRINIITHPIKIDNINFKNFEIQNNSTNDQK